MDYVGVKRFDAGGELIGEFRIVGLFTSTAYTRSTRSIPYLRRKVDAVLTRAGFDPDGHSGKALVNVLENYPRDELFQIDEDTLYQFALALLQLDERPRVRVLPRRDRFDRFVSILVYVPRERYDSGIRKAIGNYLAEAYNGRVSAFYPFFTEGPLVRVHFIIGRSEGAAPNPDRATLEAAVGALVRTWTDELAAALAQAYEPGRARGLLERYRDAFSDGYREAYSPLTAVSDIRVIEGLSAARPLGVDFHRARRPTRSASRSGATTGRSRSPSACRCSRTWASRWSTSGPTRSSRNAEGEPAVWFHDMTLERAAGAAGRSRRQRQRAGGRVPGGDDRRRRERRLQRAGARRRPDVAGSRAHPRRVALPAADPRALLAGLHVGDPGQARRHRRRHRTRCSTRASIRA